MKVLDLRLYAVYYDLIKAGKKKKEYRKLDEYYVGRLIGGVDIKAMGADEKEEFLKNLRDPHERDETMKKMGAYYLFGNKPGAYTHIRFRRGATNTFMIVGIEDLKIEAGQFVFDLGKIEDNG